MLETSVEDLLALEKAGLLSTSESRLVLQRRSKYEQSLSKSSERNERVFLAYVEFEKSIERLLKTRAKVRAYLDFRNGAEISFIHRCRHTV